MSGSFICIYSFFPLAESTGEVLAVSFGVSWEKGQFDTSRDCSFWLTLVLIQQRSQLLFEYVCSESIQNASLMVLSVVVSVCGCRKEREGREEERRGKSPVYNFDWSLCLYSVRYIGNTNFSLELIDFKTTWM